MNKPLGARDSSTNCTCHHSDPLSPPRHINARPQASHPVPRIGPFALCVTVLLVAYPLPFARADVLCCDQSSCGSQPDEQTCTDTFGGVVTSDCGNCIAAGTDCWTTPCDGRTWYDFCKSPLPAGLFGLGSAAFTGKVLLGDPAGDTQIARYDPLVLGVGQSDSTSIELKRLNLASCQPFTVMINGQATLWNVTVTDLEAGQAGTMTISKTYSNGGTFVSSLIVNVQFTFTCVNNCPTPGATVTIPNAQFPATFVAQLGSITPAPWVHTAADAGPECHGFQFVPGIDGNPPPDCLAAGATEDECCVEIGHAGPGHRHVVLRTCTACDCGACCDPLDRSCEFIVQSAPDSAQALCEGAGGEFAGSGTTCDDFDNDGIANWFELNDCCGEQTSVCDVLSNPDDSDTDNDGLADGVDPDPCNRNGDPVPASSDWGLGVLVLSVIAGGSVVLRRSRLRRLSP